MTQVSADNLHRTVKLEIDEGRASTVDEANRLASSYVLQVEVGGDLQDNPALQAAVLTAVNAGRRAFLGGVQVRSSADPVLTAGWGRSNRLSEAIGALGGRIVDELSAEHPTLALGGGSLGREGLVLHPTWQRWSGGVVELGDDRLAEGQSDSLAATLAAAMGVSECFQRIRGNPETGSRSVGLSLWRPELDWRDEDSFGPEMRYLPARAWILGLGHLGQAYCWCLGCLPYTNPAEVMLYLVDYDVVEDANESTGLLVDRGAIGRTKARAVADRLAELDMQTRIVERPFDWQTRRTANEPTLALAGFDDPQPRRLLENANFERVIDAGLGARADHYNEIQLHTFPSKLSARTAFQSRPGRQCIPSSRRTAIWLTAESRQESP